MMRSGFRAQGRDFVSRSLRSVRLGVLVAVPVLLSQARAETTNLVPSKDNTLYQHASGALSNGAGENVFSGRTGSQGGFKILRAMLAFDLSAIPQGAQITSAKLTLYLTNSHSTNQTHSLHRVLADWGEGTSWGDSGDGAPATPGDATWLHRYYPDVFWATPGGEFVATASASLVVLGSLAYYNWSSAGMVADVQQWVDQPESNFGWMLRGNEVSTGTARKFASRSMDVVSIRPRLEVQYTPPPPPPACIADVNNDGVVGVPDLLAIISAWGPCPNPPNTCPADIAPARPPVGDGQVGVLDLLKVIQHWGPCP